MVRSRLRTSVIRARRRGLFKIPIKPVAKGLGIVFVLSLLALGLAQGGRAFLSHPYFTLQEIRVDGEMTRVQPEELLRLSRLAQGRGIWDVSLGEVRSRLEKHPWIARAAVWRELPGRIVLKVRERQPVAIAVLDRLYYVDASGAIFKRVSHGDAADYPILTGLNRKDLEKGSEEAREQILSGLAFLRAYGVQGLPYRISEVRLDKDAGLTFFLQDHPVSVQVGFGQWQDRLARFVQVMALWKEREGDLAGMDLRFARQGIVRLRQSSL